LQSSGALPTGLVLCYARPVSQRRETILIVKTGEPVPPVLERRGQFADLIREAIGPAWTGGYEVVDIVTEVPPDPGEVAAVVITGSPASVPDREPWMRRAEAWLRAVVASGTPTFGICFGHQMLAQALGGEVQRNPRGREMGTVPIERRGHDASPIFAGVPERFLAQVTHVDSVVRLPPGAEPLARSDREDHHAIRFAEACYGVQFHPEMDADVMRAYVLARREILSSEGFAVEDMVAGVAEAHAARQTLRNFIRYFLAGSQATPGLLSER
jgi:GMP synthase (glutamine-hydrolysing)